VVLLGALGGIAVAAQDKYALQVPGGLAFSKFRGYQDWQTVAVSHNGNLIATILGNPAMIAAHEAGIPSNGEPFPDGAKLAKTDRTHSDLVTERTHRRRRTTPSPDSDATQS
jgi:hypothetical protein